MGCEDKYFMNMNKMMNCEFKETAKAPGLRLKKIQHDHPLGYLCHLGINTNNTASSYG